MPGKPKKVKKKQLFVNRYYMYIADDQGYRPSYVKDLIDIANGNLVCDFLDAGARRFDGAVPTVSALFLARSFMILRGISQRTFNSWVNPQSTRYVAEFAETFATLCGNITDLFLRDVLVNRGLGGCVLRDPMGQRILSAVLKRSTGFNIDYKEPVAVPMLVQNSSLVDA